MYFQADLYLNIFIASEIYNVKIGPYKTIQIQYCLWAIDINTYLPIELNLILLCHFRLKIINMKISSWSDYENKENI